MAIADLRKLQAERSEIVAKLEEMTKRNLSPEEQTAFDGLVNQVNGIDERVKALETEMAADAADDAAEAAPVPAAAQQNASKLETIKRSNRRSEPMISAPNYVGDVGDKRAIKNRADSIRGWMLKGTRGFRNEYAKAAHEIGFDLNSNSISIEGVGEERAQGIGSTSIGGALVNPTFYGTLTSALKDYNGVRQIAKILQTSNGSNINMPCVDDTSNAGTIIAENGSISEVALTFSSKTSVPYKFSSGQILTSYELLQDSLIDVESLVAQSAGVRIGRAEEDFFTIGTGSGQPQGVVTGSYAGVTAAATNAIVIDEVLDLFFSLDPAYKQSQSCAFMCHSSVLSALSKLRGADGHPVLSNNYNQADGRVPQILGYPVIINQHMSSTLAAGNKVLLFGDFSAYLVRDVAGDGGLTIIRQSETYATSGQIGWVAIHRSGGLLLAANSTTQNPIKHLKMAAS